MKLSEIMFALLRFEISGVKPFVDLQNPIDSEMLVDLYKLSKRYDIAHLIGDALDKNGLLLSNLEVKKKFLQERNTAIYRYEQQKYELEQISTALCGSKIAFIPLKGVILREYYPEPWMRTSCDIDILVREERLNDVADILIGELGYQRIQKSDHDIGFLSPSCVCVELHFSLMETEEKFQSVLDEVWGYIVEKEQNCLYMSNEMFYFHHIAHMAKHFKAGGCGVRPFLDCWLLQNLDEYNECKVDLLLKKGGLLCFANKVKRIVQLWFEQSIEADEVDREFEAYILHAGMYGDFENRAAIKQIENGGMIRYFFSRVFIPYTQLKYHFPILERHKWLMPFSQIGRWFKLIFGKGTGVFRKELRANIDLQKTKQEHIAKLLKDLDL